VSARTLRYWMTEGVLDGPVGMGPGGHYTEKHVEAVFRIKKLKEEGKMLVEIKGPTEPGYIPLTLPSDARPWALVLSKEDALIIINDKIPLNRKKAILEWVDKFPKKLNEPVTTRIDEQENKE